MRAGLKRKKTEWRKWCVAQPPPIHYSYAVPYSPYRNDKCERLNRSLADALRTSLMDVDKSEAVPKVKLRQCRR
jgi:hypothetical protein